MARPLGYLCYLVAQFRRGWKTNPLFRSVHTHTYLMLPLWGILLNFHTTFHSGFPLQQRIKWQLLPNFLQAKIVPDMTIHEFCVCYFWHCELQFTITCLWLSSLWNPLLKFLDNAATRLDLLWYAYFRTRNCLEIHDLQNIFVRAIIIA